MIRIKKVAAFAQAEMRLTRRLVRYWVFISISYLIAIIFFLFYSVLHGVYSSYSATEAMLSPRYLVSTIGLYYLLIYIGGSIFLGFDVRARDRKEQMVEILDSRPYTNLELVFGRFIALLISSWVPVIILAFILEFLGLLLPLPFGDTVEVYSLFAFVFLMALPALAFVLSLVFLVTFLIRNRLAAAVVLLLMIGGDFWAVFKLPSIYSPLFDITGSTIISPPSEIIPSLTNLQGWLQRIGVLIAALGMLGLSAAVHPRLDAVSSNKLITGGIGIIILAIFMTGFGYYENINIIKLSDTWKKAHMAIADTSLPDLRTVSGRIRIEPGKALDLDLVLAFRAPEQDTLRRAVFTLNPGQKIREATDASGNPLSFTHENGILEINLQNPLDPGKETVINLSVTGLPDNRFGYLESVISTENLEAGQRNLSMLGLDRYIYDSRFVALMPGICWLPSPGSEKDRNDPRRREVDYFNVDLTVDLPSGWLAAGPGRRTDMKDREKDRVKFRFSPSSPVPEVAIIASKFESRSFETGGVKMEILVHPVHMKNIELFADSGEEIRSWISAHMKESGEYGISYPYGGLTLVEVPNTLRGYGGGWRMDTTMAPPGILLMRENSFPTARFDWPFRDPDTFKNTEGGVSRAKMEALRTFFMNDISGCNIFSGAARNFFLYQTMARGPGAIALNYVMEVLSSFLVSDTGTYFSAHNFAEEDVMGPVFGALVLSQNNELSSKSSMTDTAIGMTTSAPEVWDQVLKVSLRDMDPWDDPARKINVLALKAGAMARCILDILGRETTAQLFSSIRESHKGGSFSFEDVKDKSKELGVDFEELFGDWLGSTSLPGFICSKSEVYRLPDSDNGMPRYQILISVSNDEPVPGVFRFRYRVGSGDGQEWSRSDPIRLNGKHAVRFGMVLFQPPEEILIEPYISLNRGSFMIPLQKVDNEKIINLEATEGLEDLPWAPPISPFIVVDNLDENFRVIGEKGKINVPKGRRTAAITLNDQGISTWSSFTAPPEWTYLDLPGSWGRYRHTTAVVRAGDGTQKAVFTSSIRKAGSWGLWIHIPDKPMSFPWAKFGTWSLEIKDGNGDLHDIEFNSEAALEGWNQVETIELPEGEVSVTLPDKTDGDLVMADAIRWSPSAGE